MSENPSLQLSRKEMMAQMGALTLAGHETTANTLSWMLWELAKHPHFQDKLRSEIRDKKEEVSLRETGVIASQVDFCIDDLESMPFLQAVVKVSRHLAGDMTHDAWANIVLPTIQEVMRFHPIVYHLMRVSKKADIIPLSEPIVAVNGDIIHEVPISKGQNVLVSICAYNR